MKLLIAISCSLLFLMCINLQAQGLYQKGTVTFKNGKSAEAYVQIDYRYPVNKEFAASFVKMVDDLQPTYFNGSLDLEYQ